MYVLTSTDPGFCFATLPVLAALAVWMQSLFGGIGLVLRVIDLTLVLGMISTAADTARGH